MDHGRVSGLIRTTLTRSFLKPTSERELGDWEKRVSMKV